jgi:hypothetical protein
VSHEQVRTDIAFVAAWHTDLAESHRWLPLEAWLRETERLGRERAGSASAHRSETPAVSPVVRPRPHGRRPLPGASTAETTAATPRPLVRAETPPAHRAAAPRDDWAVWNSVPPRRSRST